MHVNGVRILVSMSSTIKFGTVTQLINAKSESLTTAVKVIRNIYGIRGFHIQIANADGQFTHLRDDFLNMGIVLNPCSAGEHVPVVERRIRTLKERVRCIFSTLPYKKLPVMMVIYITKNSNFWLNVFPPKDGVSGRINPRALMTGYDIDAQKHLQLECGEYAEVHDEHDNTMTPRTTGAIALMPNGNIQGGHLFYSLRTGKILNRKKWTPVPMPESVIPRMDALAKDRRSGLRFTNANNEEYDDDDTDSDDSDDDDYDDESDSESDDDDSADGDDSVEGVEVNDIVDDIQHNNDTVTGDDEPEDEPEHEPEAEPDNAPEVEILPPALRKIANNGTLPAVIQSRT